MTGIESMTPGQGGIEPLFATPFAAVNTGTDRDFNERLVVLCESQHGRDDFLDSADETAGELKRHVLRQSCAVVASLNRYDAEAFARLHVHVRGWCSIVPRNGHLGSQHFPGASWLAVYCAQAGEAEPEFASAGVLRLCERRLGSVYRDASTRELKSPYRYGNHTWTPMPGWMALFPAHVPHEVSLVRSATPLVLVFALLRFSDPGVSAGPAG